MIKAIATWAACGISLLAATLWFHASRTPIPKFPDVGLDSDSSVFEPVRDALLVASHRNKQAAAASALAALFTGLALVL
jgi:hypothetical protein